MSQEPVHSKPPEGASGDIPQEPVYREYLGQVFPPPSYPGVMFPPPPYARGPFPPPIPPYPGSPNYGNPNYGEPPVQPLPLKEGLRQLPYQWWNVVWKPSIRKFVEEKGKANWSIVWVALLIYAAIYAILMFLQTYIPGSFLNLSNLLSHNYTTSSSTGITELSRTIIQFEQLASFITIPISFFISEGIYFLIAKLFKGKGTFLQQVYANILYMLPTQVILVVLFSLPFAGGILGYVLNMFTTIYFYILRIFATQAVHRLSIGRALAVVFIPLGLGIVLSVVLVFVMIFMFIGIFAFYLNTSIP